MSNSESDEEDGRPVEGGPEIVSITEQGQATIPKRFRDELGIEVPGKVQFRENERGEIIVEAPSTFEEFRGIFETGKQSATEMLREERERDREREEEKLDSHLPE